MRDAVLLLAPAQIGQRQGSAQALVGVGIELDGKLVAHLANVLDLLDGAFTVSGAQEIVGQLPAGAHLLLPARLGHQLKLQFADALGVFRGIGPGILLAVDLLQQLAHLFCGLRLVGGRSLGAQED